MREEIQNNPKLFISIVITGMVLIVVMVVFLLIFIWSPKNNTANTNKAQNSQNIKNGSYIYTTTSEKQVVEKYCSNILDILSMQNKDDIFNLVLKEYTSYMGLNKDTLYDELKQKGLIGKLLKFYSYNKVSHNKYGQVFEIEIGTYDSYVKEKILLIESSPRNYKVSFDGFIGDDSSKKEIIRDGIKMTINNVREFSSEVQVKFTIENVLNSDIVLNKQGNYENIYLKLNSGAEIRTSSVWLSGVIKTLTPNTTFNLDLQFNPGYLLSGTANTIVIKDVYNNISKETTDLEFPIY
jgi:hypothetical protein